MRDTQASNKKIAEENANLQEEMRKMKAFYQERHTEMNNREKEANRLVEEAL